jgi:hypothetical protein
MMNIDFYLELVATALNTMSDDDMNAVEDYEDDYPEVVDASYKAGGSYEYDPLNGVVHST